MAVKRIDRSQPELLHVRPGDSVIFDASTAGTKRYKEQKPLANADPNSPEITGELDGLNDIIALLSSNTSGEYFLEAEPSIGAQL